MGKPFRREWEMLSGFPACTCNRKPEQLPDELAPGVPRACSHLYVKKSANEDLFRVSLSPATSVGSRAGSPECGKAEKPQGVRVLRGGMVSIVIYPMPVRANNDASCAAQSGPTFASLADERAADDMGILLMGGVSRANSPGSKRRTVRSAGRCSPCRRSRPSSVDGRTRKSCNPGSVTLKMPSHAFEVDIKLEKMVPETTANGLAGGMVHSSEADRENGNRIRCYKHTISSLISSRIADMNTEAKMLQELNCKRKGAHRPQHPPQLPKNKANAGSMKGRCDGYSKQFQRQPRQFSFH